MEYHRTGKKSNAGRRVLFLLPAFADVDPAPAMGIGEQLPAGKLNGAVAAAGGRKYRWKAFKRDIRIYLLSLIHI